jgi:hypothetical protein
VIVKVCDGGVVLGSISCFKYDLTLMLEGDLQMVLKSRHKNRYLGEIGKVRAIFELLYSSTRFC